MPEVRRAQTWTCHEAQADADDVPAPHSSVDLWPDYPRFSAVVDRVQGDVAELVVGTSNSHPRAPDLGDRVDVHVSKLQGQDRWSLTSDVEDGRSKADEQVLMADGSGQSASGVERFRGPDYLTGTTPDRDAMERLQQVDSHTAQRLIKYVRGGWPGMLSGEDFLGPLTACEGDILFRVIDTPGGDWIWWRGEPLGSHFYGRIHTLPHYQDHKVTGRRNSNTDTIAAYLTDGQPVIPVHVENIPETVWSCISTDRPYKNRPVEPATDRQEGSE